MAALLAIIGARTLTFNVASMSSSEMSLTSERRLIPALLTGMSSPPYSATARSTDAWTAAASALSAGIATAQRLDRADHLRGSRRRLLVGDRHIGTFRGQRLGDRGSDPRLAPVIKARFPLSVIARILSVSNDTQLTGRLITAGVNPLMC